MDCPQGGPLRPEGGAPHWSELRGEPTTNAGKDLAARIPIWRRFCRLSAVRHQDLARRETRYLSCLDQQLRLYQQHRHRVKRRERLLDGT